LSGQESAADREVFRRLKLPDGRRLGFVIPEIVPDGKRWLIGRVREWPGTCNLAVRGAGRGPFRAEVSA
jgi:hypothetical protein